MQVRSLAVSETPPVTAPVFEACPSSPFPFPAGDDVVRQTDCFNCGIFCYRWLEQRACNSVISYFTHDVTYLRVLLQVELLCGRPVRIIEPLVESGIQAEVSAQLREWADRTAGLVSGASWHCHESNPPTPSIDSLHRELSMRLDCQLATKRGSGGQLVVHEQHAVARASTPPWSEFAIKVAKASTTASHDTFTKWECGLDAFRDGDSVNPDAAPLMPVAGETPGAL